MSERPQILLVPSWTEVQWVIALRAFCEARGG
jgi:hypothetical protein